MMRITRVLSVLVYAAALTCLTLTPAAHAQPNPVQGEPQWFHGAGTDLFRAFLDRNGIQPVTQAELRNLFIDDDIIVVIIGSPARNVLGRDPLFTASQAILNNGAVLIATDEPLDLDLAGRVELNPAIRFNGNTVVANRNDSFDSRIHCPFVVPVSPEEQRPPVDQPGPIWNLFRGLSKIATNTPTFIEEPRGFRGEFQFPLARLPASTRFEFGGGFRAPPLFAVGGEGKQQPDGRAGYAMLALADASLFINQMIMEPETHNFQFTLNTIEFLQGPNQQRKKCIFIENGRLIESFDGVRKSLPQTKPPMPDIGSLLQRNQDKLVDAANRLIDHVQENDGLHNRLVGNEDNPDQQRNYARWIERFLILAAIAITFMLLIRSLRARHATNLPTPLRSGTGRVFTGPPGVFERREQELVYSNNLYEPVRNLLRDFFESAGAASRTGGRLPALVISSEVRKPESLRQAIRDMWRIAHGPPLYITAQRWFELEPYLVRLRHAHAEGKWRFADDEQRRSG